MDNSKEHPPASKGNGNLRHEWTMLAVRMATPVMIGLVIFALDARRQLALQDTLKDFVSKETFQDYVDRHHEDLKRELQDIGMKFSQVSHSRSVLQEQIAGFSTQLNSVDKRLEVLIGKLEVEKAQVYEAERPYSNRIYHGRSLHLGGFDLPLVDAHP